MVARDDRRCVSTTSTAAGGGLTSARRCPNVWKVSGERSTNRRGTLSKATGTCYVWVDFMFDIDPWFFLVLHRCVFASGLFPLRFSVSWNYSEKFSSTVLQIVFSLFFMCLCARVCFYFIFLFRPLLVELGLLSVSSSCRLFLQVFYFALFYDCMFSSFVSLWFSRGKQTWKCNAPATDHSTVYQKKEASDDKITIRQKMLSRIQAMTATVLFTACYTDRNFGVVVVAHRGSSAVVVINFCMLLPFDMFPPKECAELDLSCRKGL